MKTCPNCKTTSLPDEAEFCPACGAKLRSSDNPQGNTTIVKRTISKERATSSSSYNYKIGSQSSKSSVDGEDIFSVIVLVIVLGSIAFLIIQAFL